MSTETTAARPVEGTAARAAMWWRRGWPLSWTETAGLLLPAIVLGALSLYNIGASSFWRDEVASVVFAKASLAELIVLIGRDRDRVGLANMATYYAILHFWLAVGETEARIRFLSVVFAILAVIPVYAVGRRVGGWVVGGIAAGAFALLPFVVQYAQEARGYSLALLVAGALTWLVLIGVDRRSTWPWLAYGIVTALGLYVHFFVALVVAAHGLWLLATRNVPGWRASAAALVPIVLASIPIPLVIAEYGGGHAWVGSISIDEIVRTVVPLFGSGWVAMAAIGLTLVAIAARRRDERLWLVVAAAYLPIVATIGISIVKPLLVPRYLIVSLPAIAVLIGWGIASLRSWWRPAAAVVMAVALIAVVPRAYADARQQDWRGAARWMIRDAQDGDRYVVRGWGRRPLEYYLERYRSGPMPRPVGVVAAAENPDVDRVWVVVAGNHEGELPPLPPGLLDSYRVVEFRAFADKVMVVLLERTLLPSAGQ